MHLVTSILHGNHVYDNGTTVVLLQNTTSYSTFGHYLVELFCGVHVFYVVLTPHTLTLLCISCLAPLAACREGVCFTIISLGHLPPLLTVSLV